MAKKSVYMDYNATTPLHPAVKEEMVRSFDLFANASSMHEPGRSARNRVEHVRQQVAAYIGAQPDEIVFTGGGSESNNTVIKMFTCPGCDEHCVHNDRNEIITSAIEHPSVIEAVEYMESMGKKVHFLPVDSTGKISTNAMKKVISERTGLVTVMLANNEIGTLQDVRAIADLAHASGALVHTDAVQAVGRIPVNVDELGVDYLSFSGHKFYAPKGIGVLYSRRTKPFCRFLHGGHQQAGRRAGTTNTLCIIGMGKALEMVVKESEKTNARVKTLRDRLASGLADLVPDIHVNGNLDSGLSNTLNVSFIGAEGEAILLYLDMEGIAVSTGSACSSGSLEPSHVLLATGVGPELAHGSIRFSLGRESTDEDVDYVLEKLPPIMQRVRKMSTVYEGGCR
ncbi:MAG: aminotransferase class V-fold PLP-dependent enzyme [Spirochaetaceae bacterium]|nr:MAG: aminotransferase class V-fold PLP-dependent enzyme [Spirochaetaceae bacterium]